MQPTLVRMPKNKYPIIVEALGHDSSRNYKQTTEEKIAQKNVVYEQNHCIFIVVAWREIMNQIMLYYL